ncbi:MAG TPA: hypothetical protein VK395_26965 [Gemmataceae bacterium]|nr:hypothetical protein [Gemmataceae bacterium]
MRVPVTAPDPPRRRLRHLAWVVAALLAVLAWYEGPSWPLEILAAAVFAIGTVLPAVFGPPYRALRWLLCRIPGIPSGLVP